MLKYVFVNIEAYDGVRFCNRSVRCHFAITEVPNEGTVNCHKCQKTQEKIDLLQSIQIQPDNDDAEETIDTSDIEYENVISRSTKKRLSSLEGITIVKQVGKNLQFIGRNELCLTILITKMS